MEIKLFYLLCALTVRSVFSKNCLTPNKEEAKCIPIRSCKILFEAIQKRDPAGTIFAKNSQCGYDKEPLVCCGTVAHAKPIEARVSSQKLPDRTVCGLEKEERRIFGGEYAAIDEFPWMAALEYTSKVTNEKVGIKCGGSVINTRFVLTAAHCLINVEFKVTGVRLGEWNTTSNPDCTKLVANRECADPIQIYGISKTIPYAEYRRRTHRHDIGLILVDRDIVYTDYIRPICLPEHEAPSPAPRTPLIVTGWGLTENGTESDIKLKLEVPVVSSASCSASLKLITIMPEHLCAGGEAGKDSCQGDSGGPLMNTYSDDLSRQTQYFLEGIVGWGVGCGRSGFPAVYTKVSKYINWIVNAIENE